MFNQVIGEGMPTAEDVAAIVSQDRSLQPPWWVGPCIAAAIASNMIAIGTAYASGDAMDLQLAILGMIGDMMSSLTPRNCIKMVAGLANEMMGMAMQ